MKFHPSTATATPIQGYANVYYNSNKYIPAASKLDFEGPTNNSTSEEKDDNEHERHGRVIRYETITITSPVLTSARLLEGKKKKNGRCTHITKDDVDELNDKLQSLLLKGTNDDEEEEEDGTTNTHIPNQKLSNTKQSNTKPTVSMIVERTKQPEPSLAGKTTTSYFGRCSLVIYNSITKDFVEVIRSARLAFKS